MHQYNSVTVRAKTCAFGMEVLRIFRYGFAGHDKTF